MMQTTLSKRDLARLEEVRVELKTLRLPTAGVRVDFTSHLRELLQTETISAYGLQETADTRRVFSFCYTSGASHQAFREGAQLVFDRSPSRFGMFNPDRPERWQRNVVRRWGVGELDAIDAASVPAIDMYRRLGVGRHAHLRLLLCDGPALLSWIGAWQDGTYEPRQRTLLAALVPDLQRRLVVERQLAQGGRVQLFEAALEAIGAAAFVLSARGDIREVNSAAKALLQRDGRALRDELRLTVGEAKASRWSVTPARTNGGTLEYLLTLRDGGDVESRVARAAHRFRLTARQRDVLAQVAAGVTNETIGAMLGISVRTVEVHVTALLSKAQVSSRAELIAALYSLQA